MRVFFILDDTVFYHPQMFNEILQRGKHQWVGAGLTTRDVLTPYLMKNLDKVGYWSAAKIALKKYALLTYATLVAPWLGPPVTMAQVCRKHGLPYRYSANVNSPEFIGWVKSLVPDVIVSSNSQIFKKTLLSVPTFGCINRHSALLPSYGGILPVMQAVAHGEKEVGVSVHYMDEGIDTGKVLSQAVIPLQQGQPLTRIYNKCFAASVDLILEALAIIEEGRSNKVILPARPKSYYSFPTPDEWRMFKERGGRVA
jgi:methionyl-tRNA formyltransferase